MTPIFSNINIKEKKNQGEKKLTKELLESADLVMVTAAHTNVDYDFVQQHSKFIFDTKNAMKSVVNRQNIELL
jgi:UDP-N-acetyl-D-glucosamine dehydrogenase